MRPDGEKLPRFEGSPTVKDGWTKEDIELAIKNGKMADLVIIPIWISMDPPDRIWVQKWLVRLSRHPNPNVRGNAILGFGHLARTTRRLNRKLVGPIIRSALDDESEYVRGHADSAKSDCKVFLKWSI